MPELLDLSPGAYVVVRHAGAGEQVATVVRVCDGRATRGAVVVRKFRRNADDWTNPVRVERWAVVRNATADEIARVAPDAIAERKRRAAARYAWREKQRAETGR